MAWERRLDLSRFEWSLMIGSLKLGSKCLLYIKGGNVLTIWKTQTISYIYKLNTFFRGSFFRWRWTIVRNTLRGTTGNVARGLSQCEIGHVLENVHTKRRTPRKFDELELMSLVTVSPCEPCRQPTPCRGESAVTACWTPPQWKMNSIILGTELTS
jgi:hypothetical protein